MRSLSVNLEVHINLIRNFVLLFEPWKPQMGWKFFKFFTCGTGGWKNREWASKICLQLSILNWFSPFSLSHETQPGITFSPEVSMSFCFCCVGLQIYYVSSKNTFSMCSVLPYAHSVLDMKWKTVLLFPNWINYMCHQCNFSWH